MQSPASSLWPFILPSEAGFLFIYFYFAKYFDRLGYGFVNNIYLLSEGMGLCCWSSFSLHPSLRRWERARNDALTPNSKTAVREIGNLFPLLSLINHLFHCRVLKIKLISWMKCWFSFSILSRIQVLSNSGIATVLVVSIWGLSGWEDKCLDSKDSTIMTALIGGVVGHYCCCNGDTWSSEIGVLSDDQPRLITTFKVQ